MPTAGFEPTISAGERPQTYALDRAATGTGTEKGLCNKYNVYITTRNSQFDVIEVLTLKITRRKVQYGGQYILEIHTCGYHNPF